MERPQLLEEPENRCKHGVENHAVTLVIGRAGELLPFIQETLSVCWLVTSFKTTGFVVDRFEVFV